MDTFKGEYVSFIDADDWADVTMLESPYGAMREDSAVMAVCYRYMAYDGYNVAPSFTGKHYIVSTRVKPKHSPKLQCNVSEWLQYKCLLSWHNAL